MYSSHHIRYLRRQDIDETKWDAVVDLLYGKSYYLDHMTAGQWDALVMGDYEVVMPLTWRRKWGVRYLYQPAFTQQLGLFANGPVIPQWIAFFLKKCGQYFSFGEIYLNYRNNSPVLKPFTNFILELDSPYGQLSGGYKQDLINNLKIAGRASLRYVQDLPLPDTISLFREQYGSRLPHLSAKDYDHFGALCGALQKKGQLLLRGIVDGSGRLLATALLPRDDQRLYLLQSTVSTAGRQVSANHFLLDKVISEWSGQSMILDFEGSEQPGIAHFYRNFGAKDQPYFFYRSNRLPWPIRYLKQPSNMNLPL
jgi:hypothetical protein